MLLAGGRIDVGGTITADGYDATIEGAGSGGSILLRAAGGVTLLPGGVITARGGTADLAPPPYAAQTRFGAPGYVRIDAWGTQPNIQGTVTPAPTVLELPHLRTQSPPRIGTIWSLDVFAPENAPILIAASLAPGSGTPTPFGPLGLDLATATTITSASAQTSHDPVASVPWSIPNASVLVGLQLWIQALAIPTGLPPRLTNTLAAIVQ
ncbi:MAG: hypothetical protein IPK26_16860 [Planctomycetes bacterium]|nr:hypothetical protein [Planctomycetota bacterium]